MNREAFFMPGNRPIEAPEQVERPDAWQYYEISNEGNKTKTHKTPFERRKQAAAWLYSEAKKTNEVNSRGYLKTHRVCSCGNAGYKRSAVDLTKKGKDLKDRNIGYCENVSACPVCGGLILNERAKEIDQGLREHMKRGGGVLMLTLTFSHKKTNLLDNSLDLLQSSYSHLIRDGFHGLRDTYHGLQKIKRLEVRYGANGWHPHLHVLLLTDQELTDLEVTALRIQLTELWIGSVEKNGGKVNREHGLDLTKARNVEQAGRYISKELTAVGDSKTESSSINPFELLDEDTLSNRRLYLEYVKAMKGKHVIEWQKGLKKSLGIIEKTDKQILDEVKARKQGEQTIAKFQPELYNRNRNSFTAMEQARQAIAAGDYNHVCFILGCSYYMTPILEGERVQRVPYFFRE